MSASAKDPRQSNAIKAPARAKRSIDNRKQDRSSRLWVDQELLRKHMSSQPKFLLPVESLLAANNYYLELADLALNRIGTMSRRNVTVNTSEKKA